MQQTTEDRLKRISNPTLNFYLDLMNDMEVPPLFHAWSLVSAASACLTRRAYFDMGAVRIMPNQYVMLVGPPGVRKSQSISFARKLVDELEGVRFAPNSTAGQMQGLITAMRGRHEKSDEDKAFADAMDGLANIDLGIGDDQALETLRVLDRSAVYVAEGELVSFLGMKAHQFIDFLGDMWDKSGAESYTYQLKRETVKIDLPCLNMLGAITPMHITTYLPPQAVGQGFTSRVLMVYEDRGKKVAWPSPIDEDGFKQVKKLMRWIFDAVEGPFGHTTEAKETIIRLYEYEVPIQDVRFLHYKERRQAHMVKLAMAMCALRKDTIINECDILDAHEMLCITEERMPECLGEYGLSPLALAKARVQDVLKTSKQPLTANRIIASCGSDVARADVTRALFEMTETGQVVDVQLRDPSGMITSGYVWPLDESPFQRNQEVKVDYLVSDRAVAPTRKQQDMQERADRSAAYIAASPTRPQMPDLSDVPDAPEKLMAEAADLAAQGFSSVAEKLRAFTTRRDNEGENE